jgi:RimJ/RimL family protein N-acetyltransferase
MAELEQRFDEQGFGLWALERLSDGAFLGFTGLNPLRPGTPGGSGMEVGWRLTPSAWGAGYASEAARAALRVAFVEVRLAQVWSLTSVTNVASQAVMRRIGMREHARFENPAIDVGHRLRPHVIFRMDRSSWEKADSGRLGDQTVAPLQGGSV